MRDLFLVAGGVMGGFVLAHLVSRTPEGKKFFDDVDSGVRAFSGAVVDGYRDREAELRSEE